MNEKPRRLFILLYIDRVRSMTCTVIENESIQKKREINKKSKIMGKRYKPYLKNKLRNILIYNYIEINIIIYSYLSF